MIYAWIVNNWIVYPELPQPEWKTGLKLIKSNIYKSN